MRFLDALHESRPDVDRLAALQQPDGGWVVDYLQISPAGSLDWRGHATVRAVDILGRNTPSAAPR